MVHSCRANVENRETQPILGGNPRIRKKQPKRRSMAFIGDDLSALMRAKLHGQVKGKIP